MPELLLLRREIARVVPVGLGADSDTFDDLHAVTFKPNDLSRVIRKKTNLGDSEIR